MDQTQLRRVLKDHEDRVTAVEQILPRLLTRDEFNTAMGKVATKDDLAAVRVQMATKDDLAAVRVQMATKDDLAAVRAQMATKDDLAAVRAQMATKDDLAAAQMATRDDLVAIRAEMATKAELNRVHVLLESVRGDINLIVEGFTALVARFDRSDERTEARFDKIDREILELKTRRRRS